MPLSKRRGQILCKLETTDGSWALGTPAAADVIPFVLPATIDPAPDIPSNDREDVGAAKLAKAPGVTGRQAGTITFDMYLAGASAAGTVPGQSAVWGLTGHDETAVPSTSVTYNRRSADDEGYSIGAIVDGLMFRFAGCRGNMSIAMTNGGLLVATISATGQWLAPVDQAFITPSGSQTIVPPKFMDASLSVLGETAMVFTEMSIDLQNDIQIRENANDATGVEGAAWIDARPVCTINPETVLVDDQDRYQDFLDETLSAISFSVGSGTGNSLAFTAPKCRFTEMGKGERAGYMTDEITAEITDEDINQAEGNDYSFVWT